MIYLLIGKFITWLFICFFIGKYDSFLYYFRARDKNPKLLEPHPTSVCLRTLIALGLGIFLDTSNLLASFLISMFNTISYGLVFSFVHNASYFYYRNKYEPYLGYSIKSNKGKNSTADIDLDYNTRLWLFIVGVVIILGTFIYYLVQY